MLCHSAVFAMVFKTFTIAWELCASVLAQVFGASVGASVWRERVGASVGASVLLQLSHLPRESCWSSWRKRWRKCLAQVMAQVFGASSAQVLYIFTADVLGF